MRPPNALELVGPERTLHPDQEEVLKHFLGKSQEEARDFYTGRGHYITEDFSYMTIEGLRYYLPPFLDYLKTDDAKHEFLAGYGVVSGLAHRIESESSFPQDVLEVAKQIAAYVKQHCKRFNISPYDEQFQHNLKVIQGAKSKTTG
jgi:hypothetical protein